jgi:ATP-dependent RNA helicase DeaD
MSFEKFGLKKELLEQLKEIDFLKATPIQEKCIPKILQGKDIVGQALTGSGKTAAFALPIINNVEKGKIGQALILTPTRELAEQVKDAFDQFGRKIGVRAASVYGGVGFGSQISNIRQSEIIVATPGRLIDHLNRKSFDLRNVKYVVLDEVDRMLDIGFEKDVNIILQHVPKEKQTIMFSATMPTAAKKIANKYLNNPFHVQVELKVDTSLLAQIAYKVPKEKRFSLLLHLLKEKKGTSLVFCRTKRDVDKIAKNLRKNGLSIAAAHGDITQKQRQSAVNAFKENKLDALIATDVASRGLDIKNVTHVYNYEIPSESDDYTHRIGRTARAGKKGDAITFVTEKDGRMFREILREHNVKIEELPEFPQVTFIRIEERDNFSTKRNGRRNSEKRSNRRNFSDDNFDKRPSWKNKSSKTDDRPSWKKKSFSENEFDKRPSWKSKFGEKKSFSKDGGKKPGFNKSKLGKSKSFSENDFDKRPSWKNKSSKDNEKPHWKKKFGDNKDVGGQNKAFGNKSREGSEKKFGDKLVTKKPKKFWQNRKIKRTK